MTAERMDPVDFHRFEPGLEVVAKPDAMGRRRRRYRCRTCGGYANAPRHRSAERLQQTVDTWHRNHPQPVPDAVPDPGDHRFVPGKTITTPPDARGHTRQRVECRVCGKFSNAARHQSKAVRLAGLAKRAQNLAERPRAPQKPRTPKAQRPGYVPPAYHPFEFGGTVIVDKQGKHRPTCKECGSVANAPRHRSPERVAEASAKSAASAAAHRAEAQQDARPPGWFSIVDRLEERGAIEPAAEAAPEPEPEPAAATQLIPGSHAFVPGGGSEDRLYSNGVTRKRERCAECGKFANAPKHRSAEQQRAWLEAVRQGRQRGLAAVAEAAPEAVAEAVPKPEELNPPLAETGGTPIDPTQRHRQQRVQSDRIAVPAAEIAMLGMAIDAVLALPVDRVATKLRLRLADVRQLVDVPAFPSLAADDAEPDPEAPSALMAEAIPQLRPVARNPVALVSAESLIRGIRNDRMRKLARRAISAGWDPAMTGSGHLALTRGQRRLVISTTASGGARGWMNLRADAKRLGIDVTGL